MQSDTLENILIVNKLLAYVTWIENLDNLNCLSHAFLRKCVMFNQRDLIQFFYESAPESFMKLVDEDLIEVLVLFGSLETVKHFFGLISTKQLKSILNMDLYLEHSQWRNNKRIYYWLLDFQRKIDIKTEISH